MKANRVLISGAGIAGLSLARRLEKMGIGYLIAEKRSSSHHSSSGIALPFNALLALREPGFEKAVLDVAHQVEEVI